MLYFEKGCQPDWRPFSCLWRPDRPIWPGAIRCIRPPPPPCRECAGRIAAIFEPWLPCANQSRYLARMAPRRLARSAGIDLRACGRPVMSRTSRAPCADGERQALLEPGVCPVERRAVQVEREIRPGQAATPACDPNRHPGCGRRATVPGPPGAAGAAVGLVVRSRMRRGCLPGGNGGYVCCLGAGCGR